ncbi:MAG: MOSC domain-containing protein, partial [Nonomuraea sp.]|nr:MOSC domain-containing protein [Nonomuraea sp.]
MTRQVLAVNVGHAGPMVVQGETIVTGFDKRPTDGAVRVEAYGLVGDDHVDDALDLDRAVLLYQRCHYDAWEAELGRELPPGTFGENLTVDWPADHEVGLGDELRIGDVRLRVTQPRIPCRKMAVRLAAGQDFPGRYLRSGRVGFFCRVEQPGHLRPGDPIELLNPGAADLTVADLARILHLDDPDPAALTAMLARPDLPEVLRTKAERLLVRATGGDLAWQGERPLVVTARRQEAAEVVSFELADPDGARLPDYAAGQFLTLSMAAGAGKPLVRTYTLAGRGSDGAYRIAVKRDGRASEHLHDQVAEGSRLNARPPRGRFVVEPGDRPVVLVSAGIGITPMVAMLEELAGSEREVHFAHGARSSRELAFGPHVRRITGSRPGLHRH